MKIICFTVWQERPILNIMCLLSIVIDLNISVTDDMLTAYEEFKARLTRKSFGNQSTCKKELPNPSQT